jgi:hypothetical protein
MPHISYITFINAFISFSFLLMSATAAVNLLVCLYDRVGNHNLAMFIDHYARWGFPVAYAGLILLAYYVTFYGL